MAVILPIVVIVLIVGYANRNRRAFESHGFEICHCHDCIEQRNNIALQDRRRQASQPWHLRNRATIIMGSITAAAIIKIISTVLRTH